MTKITLYEKIIGSHAKKSAKNFPIHVRHHTQQTIEHLLETGRDFAIIQGKVIEEHNNGKQYCWLDKSLYRACFEDNSEMVLRYCEFASSSESPLSTLQLFSNDYIELIGLRLFKVALKEGLPRDPENLKRHLDLLKQRGGNAIWLRMRKSEAIDNIDSHNRYDSGFYERTPFDSRPPFG